MDSINNTNNDNSSVYEMIEKEFGRTLSPMEYEIIKEWLNNNISEELIKEALKEATYSGVSNLRYIDKILYEWGKLGIKTKEDISKKKKNRKENKKVDLDNVDLDWNWFDGEED
jgi:DNA replication protein